MSSSKVVLKDEGAAILSEYKTLVQQLVSSLLSISEAPAAKAESNSNNYDPEVVMQKILKQEEALQYLANNVVQHQRKVQLVNRMSERVRAQELVIMQLSTRLKMAENALEQMVDTAKRKLEVQEKAKSRALDPDELVAYSGLISYHVAPPPNWSDGLPLGPFRTGFPYQMEDTRRSKWFMTHYGVTDGSEVSVNQESTVPGDEQAAVKEEDEPAMVETRQPPVAAEPEVVEVVDLDFDFGSSDDDSD